MADIDRAATRLLYDGYAVLQEIRRHPQAAGRTSAENVSDVLDAMVRIIAREAVAFAGLEFDPEKHGDKIVRSPE